MDITTFMMRFGVTGNARPMSQTFTSSGTFVVPAGVTAVDMSGNGARGTSASGGQDYYYETKQIFATRRSDGARVLVSSDRSFRSGTPAHNGYCNAVVSSPSDPTYSSNQTCYAIDGVGSTPYEPPTTGASTTGLGKTFPGSTGSGAAPTTTFSAVPVTAGNYSIVVPSGGSLTINYYG